MPTPSSSNDPHSPVGASDGPTRSGENDGALACGEQAALELLPGEFTGALQHTVATLVADTAFVLPARVDRRPISYDLLAYFVHELGALPLATDDNLAMAFGLRVEDVSRAATAWRRHVERVGVPCPGCGSPMDPAFGAKCSVTCTGTRKPSRSPRRRSPSSSRSAS